MNVLFSLLVNLTQPMDIREESPIEELPRSDWSLSKSAGGLSWLLIDEGGAAHCR